MTQSPDSILIWRVVYRHGKTVREERLRGSTSVDDVRALLSRETNGAIQQLHQVEGVSSVHAPMMILAAGIEPRVIATLWRFDQLPAEIAPASI